MDQQGGDVTSRLTRSEALVLFEMLARLDSGRLLPLADSAEEQVLWRLEGQLESTFPEPLASNYEELVAEARRTVRAAS
jgi:hypothetical protein